MKIRLDITADPFLAKYKFNRIPTRNDDLTAEYYGAIKEHLNNLIQQAYQAERFGKNPNTIYNCINDFHYLYALLMIISDEMQQDADRNEFINKQCPNDYGIDYYVEKYHLNCIIKHFYCNCLGYDILPLLNIFGLNPNNTEQDGMGFMHIQYNRESCQGNRKVFKVS